MNVVLYLLIGTCFGLVLAWARVRYTGFIAQNPKEYVGKGIDFDLRKHLNGPIKCEGVIFGPLGRVTSRFVGELDCTWSGDLGIMYEKFTYDDGSIQIREWSLELGVNGRVKATAADVLGVGAGVLMGPSLQLKYRMRMPDSVGGHVLNAVDWMYLTPNGNIVNRSQFRKYGFKVAELVATLRPVNSSLKENM